ncbi:MAG: hypothetical protein DMG32_00295 [Acidobacteria bacterium]|nr:MAG: hypothetical protein DMG32_00295 [Acidobacteriota bacterium]
MHATGALMTAAFYHGLGPRSSTQGSVGITARTFEKSDVFRRSMNPRLIQFALKHVFYEQIVAPVDNSRLGCAE